MQTWKTLEIPEAMYLSRQFRDVAVAYEEAKADLTQDATLEDYYALLHTTAMMAITHLEARVLTLEGVDFVPPDWQPPAE